MSLAFTLQKKNWNKGNTYMILYNTNKESLLKMLKEILTKQNGKFFSHSDSFDPAWGGLFNLLLRSQHPRFSLENN
jgi:hypothetical protein